MISRICAAAGCKNKATNNHRCDKHQYKKATNKTRERNVDLKGKNVHDSYKWKQLRERKMRENPLCEHCFNKGLIVSAKEVDHILEIKDYPELAWNITNLQSLCVSCHRIKTYEYAKADTKNSIGVRPIYKQ